MNYFQNYELEIISIFGLNTFFSLKVLISSYYIYSWSHKAFPSVCSAFVIATMNVFFICLFALPTRATVYERIGISWSGNTASLTGTEPVTAIWLKVCAFTIRVARCCLRWALHVGTKSLAAKSIVKIQAATLVIIASSLRIAIEWDALSFATVNVVCVFLFTIFVRFALNYWVIIIINYWRTPDIRVAIEWDALTITTVYVVLVFFFTNCTVLTLNLRIHCITN